MFLSEPLIEFAGQERYELDRITSTIHTYHNYMVGMDSKVKKDLTLFCASCNIVIVELIDKPLNERYL